MKESNLDLKDFWIKHRFFARIIAFLCILTIPFIALYYSIKILVFYEDYKKSKEQIIDGVIQSIKYLLRITFSN